MTHPFLSYSGYGLVPALPNPCSFLGFSSCSLVSNFLFRFVVVHSSQIYLVWLYDHHLRGVFSLLPIGRRLCSFARIFGYKPRCFGLQRRQNCPTLSSARYHVFGTFPTLFLGFSVELYIRPRSLLISLIHLLLSSLCSQSAACSFLFRVFLLLTVVN